MEQCSGTKNARNKRKANKRANLIRWEQSFRGQLLLRVVTMLRDEYFFLQLFLKQFNLLLILQKFFDNYLHRLTRYNFKVVLEGERGCNSIVAVNALR